MNFQKFTDLKPATQTVVAKIDVQFDLDQLFVSLPIFDVCSNRPGSITCMYYKNQKRYFKDNREVIEKDDSNSFKNAIIVNMVLSNDRHVSFKVSPWGKFQLTGCKTEDHYVHPVLHFIKHLNLKGVVQIWFIVVMKNIYFNLPKGIDLETLSHYLLHNESFVPTFIPSISQSLQLKYTPKLQDRRVPQVSITKEQLSKNEFPSLTQKNIDELIQTMNEEECQRLFKVNPFSITIYKKSKQDTSKVFISGRGEELEVAYNKLIEMFEIYYANKPDTLQANHIITEQQIKKITNLLDKIKSEL